MNSVKQFILVGVAKYVEDIKNYPTSVSTEEMLKKYLYLYNILTKFKF